MDNVRPNSRRWRLALLALLLAYGVFLAMHFEPIAAGSDSGGYMNSARLFSRGEFRERTRVLPEFPLAQAGLFMYVPLGCTDTQRTGWLTPTYPIGLSLQYAVAGRIAGWHWGILLVGVCSALGAVACTYLCLREFEVDRGIAAIGAGALAVSPMFLFTSFVPLSDTPATAWCAAAVLAALRARRTNAAAYVAGFALSVAVLVRPTNVLVLPALVVFLGTWRQWLRMSAGAFPGAVVALAYNHVMYGNALRTGYGPAEELFRRELFIPTLKNYLWTLPNILPLAVAALLLLPLLPWRTRARDLIGCVLWLGAFFGVYAFYEFTHHTWWYLRFVLPAFPPLIILAGIGISAVSARVAESWRARARMLLVSAVIAVSLVTSVRWVRSHNVMWFPLEQKPHLDVSRWARAHLPPNAAIFCFHLSTALYFYTDFPILRSDQFSPDDFARFQDVVKKSGRPVYAILLFFDEPEAFKEHIPGPWQKIGAVAPFNVWELRPGEPATRVSGAQR